MSLQNQSDGFAVSSPEPIPHSAPSTSHGDSRSAGETFVLRAVSSLSAVELAALERLAFEYGQSPDAYLAIEADRHCFLSPDHTAAMSVVVSGSYFHISGGILAPEELRRTLIFQLVEHARKTQCLFACYSITERDRPYFEDAGWEVTKFAEDTTLKLGPLNWSGKSYEWVRRQSNYCQRAGLTCREVSPHTLDAESWKKLTDELFEIQREDLKDRVYASEVKLLVGKLQPDHLGRRRLFVAEDRDKNRIEAFVVANPMRGGTGWALEMYRKRQSAPRGAVPFLMKWIIDALKAEGVDEVSLCMLLWKGTHTFSGKRTSALVRWGLVITYHAADMFYNTKGITHFKTRFRPELSNCYSCVTPRTTILSCLNFFYIIGAFSLSPRNLVRSLWRTLTRRRWGATATERESD
jgi:phosphatidylglycerol lysyltransferase